MKRCFLLIALAVLTCSCDEPVSIGVKKMHLTPAQMQMLSASNDFTFSLFRQVADAGEDKCFISPLSASFALAMAANGANGETQQQMLSVLGFDAGALAELNEYHHNLLTTLPNLDNKTKIAIANALFVQPNFPLEADFVSTCRQSYDAQVDILDFMNNPSGAAAKINAWAARNTNNKIKKVVDGPTVASLRLMLANALYFKGKWDCEFDKSNTRKEPFTAVDGSVSQVDMMHITDHFRYAQTDAFRMVELPYKGGAYVMDVFLPAEGKTIADVRHSLSNEAMAEAYSHNVELRLPRFTMNYERRMNEDLQALGMTRAFTGAADFSNMSRVPMCIDFVKQNTFLAVDEEGTEAAAVTVIGFKYTSAGPEETIPFYVDEPFVLLIREVQQGTILFIGEVNKL